MLNKKIMMKILFTLIACTLLTFSIKAQLIYNEEGDVVPFSLAEKYKTLIDTAKVNTREFKSYDNDSLFNFYNHQKLELYKKSSGVSGFTVDSSLIDLKKVATKYDINEGTVWIYKIESKTAYGFDIQFKHLLIPEGGYFCVYSNGSDPPRIYQTEDLNGPQFTTGMFGNKIFLEFFEPKKARKGNPIIISNINYTFYSPFKKKDEEINNGSNLKLKSGNFGTAVNNCQYNVVCPEVSSWGKESRSVVFIYLKYIGFILLMRT